MNLHGAMLQLGAWVSGEALSAEGERIFSALMLIPFGQSGYDAPNIALADAGRETPELIRNGDMHGFFEDRAGRKSTDPDHEQS